MISPPWQTHNRLALLLHRALLLPRFRFGWLPVFITQEDLLTMAIASFIHSICSMLRILYIYQQAIMYSRWRVLQNVSSMSVPQRSSASSISASSPSNTIVHWKFRSGWGISHWFVITLFMNHGRVNRSIVAGVTLIIVTALSMWVELILCQRVHITCVSSTTFVRKFITVLKSTEICC